jgi:uncharacterized membrane protein
MAGLQRPHRTFLGLSLLAVLLLLFMPMIAFGQDAAATQEAAAETAHGISHIPVFWWIAPIGAMIEIAAAAGHRDRRRHRSTRA